MTLELDARMVLLEEVFRQWQEDGGPDFPTWEARLRENKQCWHLELPPGPEVYQQVRRDHILCSYSLVESPESLVTDVTQMSQLLLPLCCAGSKLLSPQRPSHSGLLFAAHSQDLSQLSLLWDCSG